MNKTSYLFQKLSLLCKCVCFYDFDVRKHML